MAVETITVYISHDQCERMKAALRGDVVISGKSYSPDKDFVTTAIRDYSGEGDVEVGIKDGRPVVRAFTHSGYGRVDVDLLDVLTWLKANHPEIFAEVSKESSQPEGD
jgi:hypothetical protein